MVVRYHERDGVCAQRTRLGRHLADSDRIAIRIEGTVVHGSSRNAIGVGGDDQVPDCATGARLGHLPDTPAL